MQSSLRFHYEHYFSFSSRCPPHQRRPPAALTTRGWQRYLERLAAHPAWAPWPSLYLLVPPQVSGVPLTMLSFTNISADFINIENIACLYVDV